MSASILVPGSRKGAESMEVAAVKGRSLWDDARRRLLRNKMAVTGMVVLAESHLSLHTWPEECYVTVDVYVCNYTTDNRAKARRLFDGLVAAFKPVDPHVCSVDRA